MASITFTATAPTGESFTRTSPSMPYVAVLMTANAGAENWGPYSWHKTVAAAHAAANATYHQSHRTTVVAAVPTAVKGKVTPELIEQVSEGWGEIPAEVMIELFEAKAAKPRKTSKKAAAPVEAEPEAPTQVEVDMPEVEPVAAKPAKKAPKTAPVTTERAIKQQLGRAIVDAAMAAVEPNLPEGLSLTEAYEIVGKWMSYIPVPKEA